MNSVSSNLITSLGTGSFKWERADGQKERISRIALFQFLRLEKVSFLEAASTAFFTAYFSYRKVELLDRKLARPRSANEISIQTTPPASPEQTSFGTQVEVQQRSYGTQIESQTRSLGTQTDSPEKPPTSLLKSIAARVGNSALDITIGAALTAAVGTFC